MQLYIKFNIMLYNSISVEVIPPQIKLTSLFGFTDYYIDIL